jgi:hypothetical protein
MAASSPAQLAANARNAQQSTGPRTPEGKARSAQNARKHGLTANDLMILPGETAEELEEFIAGFQSEINPQGYLQQVLFNELVGAAWNLRRVRRMQAELCAGASYLEMATDHQFQMQLDRLERYRARLERTFARSLKELKSLQTNAVLSAALPETIQVEAPLAAASEITKRTQFPAPQAAFQPPESAAVT